MMYVNKVGICLKNIVYVIAYLNAREAWGNCNTIFLHHNAVRVGL